MPLRSLHAAAILLLAILKDQTSSPASLGGKVFVSFLVAASAQPHLDGRVSCGVVAVVVVVYDKVKLLGGQERTRIVSKIRDAPFSFGRCYRLWLREARCRWIEMCSHILRASQALQRLLGNLLTVEEEGNRDLKQRTQVHVQAVEKYLWHSEQRHYQREFAVAPVQSPLTGVRAFLWRRCSLPLSFTYKSKG